MAKEAGAKKRAAAPMGRARSRAKAKAGGMKLKSKTKSAMEAASKAPKARAKSGGPKGKAKATPGPKARAETAPVAPAPAGSGSAPQPARPTGAEPWRNTPEKASAAERAALDAAVKAGESEIDLDAVVSSKAFKDGSRSKTLRHFASIDLDCPEEGARMNFFVFLCRADAGGVAGSGLVDLPDIDWNWELPKSMKDLGWDFPGSGGATIRLAAPDGRNLGARETQMAGPAVDAKAFQAALKMVDKHMDEEGARVWREQAVPLVYFIGN